MSKNIIRTDEDKNLKLLKKASMTLDDFVWAMQKLDINQLRDAADLLRSSLERDDSSSSVARTYKSGDPNKHFLIGVLPRLFQDRQLFPLNEDIADFAAAALRLEMSRAEKRSRYEIIGKVVCETDSLDEAELSLLVQALERLVGDKDKLAVMAARKRAGSFSWNETLQELLKS